MFISPYTRKNNWWSYCPISIPLSTVPNPRHWRFPLRPQAHIPPYPFDGYPPLHVASTLGIGSIIIIPLLLHLYIHDEWTKVWTPRTHGRSRLQTARSSRPWIGTIAPYVWNVGRMFSKRYTSMSSHRQQTLIHEGCMSGIMFQCDLLSFLKEKKLFLRWRWYLALLADGVGGRDRPARPVHGRMGSCFWFPVKMCLPSSDDTFSWRSLLGTSYARISKASSCQ